MDFSKYRLKMQADFVRFRFKTELVTDAQGLLPKLKKAVGVDNTGFERLDHLPGGKATEFSVNVQDPKDPARLQQIEEGLVKYCGVVGRPVLDAWEITLDAMPNKGAGVTRRQAAEMAAQLALTCAYRFPKEYSFRVYNKWGAEEVPSTVARLANALESGYSFAIGNQRYDRKRRAPATPISMRVYLKERDNGQDLGEGRFYPKIEFTFQGEAFPFRHPEDLNDFDFTEWNRENGFFNFREADIAQWNPYAVATIDLAIPQRFATVNEERRKNARGTKANIRLNRATKDAAIAFSNRWGKHPACRKSTTSESENPVTVRDEGSFTNNYPYNLPSSSFPSDNEITVEDLLNPETVFAFDDPVSLEDFLAFPAAENVLVGFLEKISRHRLGDANAFLQNPSARKIRSSSGLHFRKRCRSARIHNIKLIELFSAQPP